MHLTKEWFKEKSACSSGYEWVLKNFPNGGDAQKIVDMLVSENKIDWALWIANNIGPIKNVLEVENLSVKGSFVFLGSIRVSASISVSNFLFAGSGIKAGWGIEAGLQIFCKKELSAEFRIFAGIAIWKKEVTDDERSVICGKLVKGAISFGLLKEEKLFQE